MKFCTRFNNNQIFAALLYFRFPLSIDKCSWLSYLVFIWNCWFVYFKHWIFNARFKLNNKRNLRIILKNLLFLLISVCLNRKFVKQFLQWILHTNDERKLKLFEFDAWIYWMNFKLNLHDHFSSSTYSMCSSTSQNSKEDFLIIFERTWSWKIWCWIQLSYFVNKVE